ncbi:MAG: AgmX/PglI C-terminal domain-containing protein [Myxococcales bacterium]
MARALALLSILLIAATPKPSKPPKASPPPEPLEVTRVQDQSVVFVQLKANQDLEGISVRVEPTGRLVEYKALRTGDVRKVAAVGASAVTVSAKGQEPIRLELSSEPSSAPSSTHKSKKRPLDRGAIHKEIARHTKQVQGCYEKALPKNPKLAGKLEMQWTILPEGTVGSVRIKSSTLEDASVGTCVLALAKSWHFPESDEEATIAFPFVFKAR